MQNMADQKNQKEISAMESVTRKPVGIVRSEIKEPMLIRKG